MGFRDELTWEPWEPQVIDKTHYNEEFFETDDGDTIFRCGICKEKVGSEVWDYCNNKACAIIHELMVGIKIKREDVINDGGI